MCNVTKNSVLVFSSFCLLYKCQLYFVDHTDRCDQDGAVCLYLPGRQFVGGSGLGTVRRLRRTRGSGALLALSVDSPRCTDGIRGRHRVLYVAGTGIEACLSDHRGGALPNDGRRKFGHQISDAICETLS